MLQPANIRAYWNTIKPYIDKIAEEYDYIAEDIYVACIQKQAFLYISDDGFMIVQQQSIPFTENSELFIWVLSKWKDKKNVLKNNLADLEALAKSIGASRISFTTRIKGFERLIKKFRMTDIKYELEI